MRKKNTTLIWLATALIVLGINVYLFIKDSVGHLNKASSLATAYVGTAGVQVGQSGPASLFIKLVNSDQRYRVVRFRTYRDGQAVQALHFNQSENFFLAHRFSLFLNHKTRIADIDTLVAVAIADSALLILLGKTILLTLLIFAGTLLARRFEARRIELRVASERWSIANQVAHDLRSPLTAINLISKVIAASKPEEGWLLKSSVLRLEKIAADLLETPNTSPPVTNCDVTITSLVQERKLAWPSVNFDLDLKASNALASMPEITLDRILANLLVNAYEAGAETIKISSRVTSNMLVITVGDSGCGMSSEMLSRAGEKHFTSKASGNGLGLSFVKAELEKINGNFKVTAELGSGTTVQLDIPVAC